MYFLSIEKTDKMLGFFYLHIIFPTPFFPAFSQGSAVRRSCGRRTGEPGRPRRRPPSSSVTLSVSPSARR